MFSVDIVRRKEALADVYRIRTQVFVEEQGLPAELETDEHDLAAVHALVRLDGRPVGTGRVVMLPAHDPMGRAAGRWAKIGRMAILPEARGQGAGRMLLDLLESVAREANVEGVVIHAQVRAKDFYASQGYEVEGEPFDEAGIEHVFMRKLL